MFATLIRNPHPMTAAHASSTSGTKMQAELRRKEHSGGATKIGRGEIAMWFWPRSASDSRTDDVEDGAPKDVLAGTPSPGGPGWGDPYAFFALGDDCTIDHFTSQSLVFDTT